MGLLSTIGSASGRAFGLTRVGAAIKDAYFNLTTLLLNTGSTNGAQNNTFLDSGTANGGVGFTITRNGNTTQGTFTPFSQTGWSNYFDGTVNSALYFNGQTAFAFGTGEFTIEGWFFMTVGSTAKIIFDFRPASTNGAYPQLSVSSTNTLDYFTNSSTVITGGSVVANSWNHFALSRVSGSTRLFLNGVQVGSTYTDSTNYTVGSIRPIFGDNGFTDANYWSGYMSNIRIIKGQGLFNGAFTPSTSPLTTTAVGATGSGAASSITGTVSLLFMQSNRNLDVANGYTINTNGTQTNSVQAFSPFAPTAAYSTTTVGGSGYFDGTGDYLTAPTNTAFNISTGDYTFECWVYKQTSSRVMLISIASAGLSIAINTSGNIEVCRALTAIDFTFTAGVPNNAWTHIAVSRSGTSLRAFMNGALLGTQTSSTTYGQGICYIGIDADASSTPYLGYMFSYRLVKGTAVYTAAFTPPTAPLTSITNTSLLLSATNAGIFDAAAKNDLETVGNAQVSTTQAKFGTTSMSFDGTGDYLTVPAQTNFSFSGDFTIECWVYFSTGPSTNYGLIDARATSGTLAAWCWDLFNSTGTKLDFIYGAARLTSASTVPTNQWVHIAVSRSGSTIRQFINGVTDANTATTSSAINSNRTDIYIGNLLDASTAFNGYIDEFRITRGYARYTANFTAPTAAFPTQ